MTLTAKYANNAKDRAGNAQLVGWFRVDRVVRGSWTRLANWSTHNYYHADGNGNITCLVNSSQGLAAKYRHDPYGNAISSSGSLASANVYRFSSKEFHSSSGLFYYGYRWYHPNLQRWPNRDPIGELGHQLLVGKRIRLDAGNLYGFVLNNPVSFYDPTGENPAAGGVIGAEVGTFVCPGLGTAIGAGVGIIVGGIVVWIAADAISDACSKPKPKCDTKQDKEKERIARCNAIFLAQFAVCEQLHTPAARDKCHQDNQEELQKCLRNRGGAYD